MFVSQNEQTGHPGVRALCFRRRVTFDRAAEFLAACASGDTEEAREMLKEARDTKKRNGEDLSDIINCANADGITALHQVRPPSLWTHSH